MSTKQRARGAFRGVRPLLSAAAVAFVAQFGRAQVVEIIDATGDGMGNALVESGDVAVDAAGNVYLSGVGSDNAFRIAPDGTIAEIIDASGDGMGGTLSGSNGISVDAAGDVYLAGDESDNAFKITDPGGANTITEIIDASGDGAGNAFSGAIGIAVDASGNVYVAGDNTHNVFRITPGGVITEVLDASGDGMGNPLSEPQFIAVDGANDVYVTAAGSNNAFKITDPGGANTITEIIDASGDGAGNTLLEPIGIAADGAGNVYVAGLGSANVFMITDPGGASTITEIIDASGDGMGNALLGPIGVAVDGAGNVYVTGFESDNAFRITDPGGANAIEEIIDSTGDGAGNGFDGGAGIAAAEPRVFVAGLQSHNAFEVRRCGEPAVVYCTAKAGLVCGIPSIGSTGQSSASSTGGFEISAGPARGNRAGILLYTNAGRSNIPFQGGTLCLNPAPLRRSVPVNSGGTPGSCNGVFLLDMNCFASGACGGNPDAFLSQVCERINCQWWGRDSVATGSFVSDAVEYFVGL